MSVKYASTLSLVMRLVMGGRGLFDPRIVW